MLNLSTEIFLIYEARLNIELHLIMHQTQCEGWPGGLGNCILLRSLELRI